MAYTTSTPGRPTMVTEGTLGRSQGRVPRPPPAEKHESVLRTSILDTALELGVGTSSTVANWIFNPVAEGDEDTEDTRSPSLTYASTATSDESTLSPARLLPSSSSPHPLSKFTSPSPSPIPGQRTVQFAFPPPPIPGSDSIKADVGSGAGKWHRKLRKPKPKGEGGGYESDVGYVSDGGKKEKEKKEKSRKEKKKNKEKDYATDRERGDESDGGYFSDMLHKRRSKKSKTAKSAHADALPRPSGSMTDYDTDREGASFAPLSSPASRKKSKSKPKNKPRTSGDGGAPGAGDDSDAGNLSESSTKRSRFFRLRRRAADLDGGMREGEENVPPVPSLPPLFQTTGVPLPIAERFTASRSGTPLGSVLTADSGMDSGRATTPLGSVLTVDSSAGRAATPLGSVTTADDSSDSLESPRRPHAHGLTRAFGDAESVRTPSTDVLRAFGFGRQVPALAGLASPSPTREQAFAAAPTRDGSSEADQAQGRVKEKEKVAHIRTRDTPRGGGGDADDPNASSLSVTDLTMLHGVPALDVPLPRPKRNPSQRRTPAPVPVQVRVDVQRTTVEAGSSSSTGGAPRPHASALKASISAPNSSALTTTPGSRVRAVPAPLPLEKTTVRVTPPSPQGRGVAGKDVGEDGKSRGGRAGGNLRLNLTPHSPKPNPETGSMSVSIDARPTSTESGATVYESIPQSPVGTFTSEYTYTANSTTPLPSPKTPAYTHTSNESSGSQTITFPTSPSATNANPRHVLAKYDLPPPSPPPMRPLPQVPPLQTTHTMDRSASNTGSLRSLKMPGRPGTGDGSRSPLFRGSLSSDGHGNGPESAPAATFRASTSAGGTRPSGSRSTPPSSAPATIRIATSNGSRSGNASAVSTPTSASFVSTPTTSISGGTPPLFLRRIPSNSIQRGRESPFPARPIAGLFRASADDNEGARDAAAPLSADAARLRGERRLGVHWQPRSASASVQDHAGSVAGEEDGDLDERRSWMDFDSSHGHGDDGDGDSASFSESMSKRDSVESRPDIESVLSALQDNEYGGDEEGEDVSGLYADHSDDDDDDRSHYRSTEYFDADGDSDTEGRERYSVWSEADRKSRASILDGKRSGDVREKLARRVEEMYSREGIQRGLVPPVPVAPLVPTLRKAAAGAEVQR